MNASERIVNAWLHSQGYFTMTNILLHGRQEIDILAVKPEGDKVKRRHIEVHVSLKPMGGIRTRGAVKNASAPFKQRVEGVVEHSFMGKDKHKPNLVVELLGSNDYEMIQVRSRRIHKDDISPERVEAGFEKHNVRLVWFEGILRELTDFIKKQGRTCSEETLSFVQLCNEFKR